jgi:uncharacterized HAD superfamily protein
LSDTKGLEVEGVQDPFESVWNHQRSYNKDVVGHNYEEMTSDEKKNLRNYFSLCITREIMDALDHTDWKNHRDEPKKSAGRNHLMEMIDIFKYWMCLCQLEGYTAKDITDAYYEKSMVVGQNFYQEMRTKFRNLDRIVGIDIDGVLCEYPDDFLAFAKEVYGVTPSGQKSSDVCSYLGVDRERYLAMKEAYRLSGRKAHLVPRKGAQEFMKALKTRGYHIVILTARPCEKYIDVYIDTIKWLDKNMIPYDALIYGESKEEKLLREFTDISKISFFLDDEFGNAYKVASIGCKSYLMATDLNKSDQSKAVECGIHLVHSFDEVLAEVDRDRSRKYTKSEVWGLLEEKSKEEMTDIMVQALDAMQQYNGRTKVQCIASAMGLELEEEGEGSDDE